MTEHAYPGYKLGRRKPDRSRPVLDASRFLYAGGAAPAHDPSADHLGQIDEWMLGGNDRFGTCGPTSDANYTVMCWQYLLQQPITVTDDQVFDLYRRSGNPGFNPSTGADDNGVDMTVMLSAMVKGGLYFTGPDGKDGLAKPLAFASIPLRPNGVAMIRAAIDIFGGVLLGSDLEVAQQKQTDEGLWKYSPSPEWGGHATMAGKYSGIARRGVADLTNITWQEPVGLSEAFMWHQVEEAYIVIYEAHTDTAGFRAGVNVDVLKDDYRQITGQALNI